MKSALEANYNMEFGENHPAMPWLKSHASSLISKFAPDADGKTAHGICRGRKFNEPLLQFSECIMCLKYLNEKDNEKIEAKWESGVHLGISESNPEIQVGMPEGAIKSQEVRTKGGDEERRNADEINDFKRLPRQPDPDAIGMEALPRVILPSRKAVRVHRDGTDAKLLRVQSDRERGAQLTNHAPPSVEKGRYSG